MLGDGTTVYGYKGFVPYFKSDKETLAPGI